MKIALTHAAQKALTRDIPAKAAKAIRARVRQLAEVPPPANLDIEKRSAAQDDFLEALMASPDLKDAVMRLVEALRKMPDQVPPHALAEKAPSRYEAGGKDPERTEDIAAADRGARALAAERAIAERFGVEALVPFAVVERILEGSSPLRAWREHRGLTQADLALRVGVTRPYYTMLEQGKKDGSVTVWRKLGQELGVMIEDILPEIEERASL